jgi:3-hydroxyacyl-[acyl-carrier-protein] dehydratase
VGILNNAILPAMRFELVDAVLECEPDRIVTVKQVSSAEEYLQDHFPGFPILPGVLMLEAMVQAARRLLTTRDPAMARHVLGSVRALKYGAMVKPGDTLRVEVRIGETDSESSVDCRGTAHLIPAGESMTDPGAPPRQVAVSGRFTLRPARVANMQPEH